MTAKFPNDTYTGRTRENLNGIVYDPTKPKVIFAEDLQAYDEEITAIEGTLGENPQGAYDTVFDWLTDLADNFSNFLSLAGGVLTDKITLSGNDEVGKVYSPGTGEQTVAIDCSKNNHHIVNGHADGTVITFSISGATNSQKFIISILQGGTTVSTISEWFATVRWAGGTAPTLTPTLNKRDTFGFIRTGANTYDGVVIAQNC